MKNNLINLLHYLSSDEFDLEEAKAFVNLLIEMDTDTPMFPQSKTIMLYNSVIETNTPKHFKLKKMGIIGILLAAFILFFTVIAMNFYIVRMIDLPESGIAPVSNISKEELIELIENDFYIPTNFNDSIGLYGIVYIPQTQKYYAHYSDGQGHYVQIGFTSNFNYENYEYSFTENDISFYKKKSVKVAVYSLNNRNYYVKGNISKEDIIGIMEEYIDFLS